MATILVPFSKQVSFAAQYSRSPDAVRGQIVRFFHYHGLILFTLGDGIA
jgi:hypothetical protein